MTRLRSLPARAALVALLVATSACASKPATGGAPRGDRNTITRAQIDSRNFTNAMEAVEALHSNWLNERAVSLGVGGIDGVPKKWVYMDSVKLGGIDQLSSVPVTNIILIRYYDGNAATQRFGIDHGQGVIQIVTQR